LKYVVWGAGGRGKVIFDLLGKQKIVAFIDSNPEKQGKTFFGCPIIDYDQYKKDYKSYVIIVSIAFGGGVTELLKKDEIFYFNIEKCPPEFMGYGWIKARHALEKLKWDIPDPVVLYGATLYTVLIYDKLKEKGYKNISVLLPDWMGEKLRTAFLKMFPEIAVKQKDEIETGSIYLTEKVNLIKAGLQDFKVIDIVDWTLYIQEYYNKRIEGLKDKYEGKRCFVVATGPSLTYDDLNRLHENNEFCISFNSIFTCFPETVWRPDCYVVLDADGVMVWKEQFQHMEDIDYKFIADCQPYFDYSQIEDQWYIYHSILDHYSISNMLFSDDFSKKVFNGSTVVYVCLQLAIYLGFKEIYLIGLDFSYKSGTKNHFTKQTEPDQKFDGMAEQNRIQDISYLAFKKACEYAHKHGIKIFNASRKTNLDVFECVNFDELF